ncbi:UNVERIFIED_CONTAM: hypothetical protein Sangu_2968000 [Sesamum angustifolium]|uniref:Uncharacterized protein n=1 Tax=Sesamum angustifolium TaxID=2727405 RepID=A0AAW2IIQ8_9LAMI
MQKIFDDMLHKNVECYVDDLVVKSKKLENHFRNLRKVFEPLRRYQLKMNLSKCVFGVTSEKFLGFIIHQWGIEIEQSKIDAILRMPEPRNIHELKSLQGKLAYLQRFISNLAGRCQPFSRLMKKDVQFQWDEALELYLLHKEREVLPYSFTLTQNYSNNIAEYQVLILGLKIAVDAKELSLKVYGDSQLVVNQLLSLYEVKKPELLPYHNYAKRLMGWLGDVELEHLPRKDNKQADALAKLASTLSMTDKEARIPICKSWVIPLIFNDDEDDMFQEEENHAMEVSEVEEEDW